MKSSTKCASLRLNPIVLAITCAFSSAFAQAQTTSSVSTLPSVTVTAEGDTEYTSPITSSATKLATPLRELPVSVHVVTEELIKDLAIVKPSELVSLVPSVQQVVGYGGVGSQWFIMRGMNNKSINYRNGYRSEDTYAPRDMANVERVDFVMGPSSAIYGNAPPAGAVNTITKTPFFGNAHNASLSLGSWASVRATGDFNWSSGDLAFRLNVATDKANSFIEYEQPQNTLIAPSFLYRIDSGTEIMYAMEYYKTRVDGFSNGLPMAVGVFDLDKGATTSKTWSQFNNENQSHRVELKKKLNDDWAFRQGLYSERTKQDLRGVSPTFNQYDGTSLSSYALIYNAMPKNDHDTDVSQTELNGSIDLFGQKHKVLLGYEYSKSRFTSSYYSQHYGDAGTYGSQTMTSISFSGETDLSESTSKTNAIYVNDQFKLGQLNVLLGLRNDWIETSSLTSSQQNSALSSRLGLLYPLTKQTSVYYSLGQSFVPNLGKTESGGVLDPEKGLQNEVGIKHAVTPKLEATLAVFDIVKSNVARLKTGSIYYLDGEQKSRGIEATLKGRVTSSLQVIANMSYLDYAKITAGSNANSSLYGAAKNVFNVWALQSVKSPLPGALSFGLGVSSVSSRPADSTNTGFELPAYTKIDAGIFYRQRNIRYALNMKNLNDAKVFDTAEGYFVQRQTPQSFVATVGIDF